MALTEPLLIEEQDPARAPGPRPRGRFWRALDRVPFSVGRAGLIVVGLLLVLPSLTTGLVLDDLVQQRQLQMGGVDGTVGTDGRPRQRPTSELFNFASGVPAENHRLVDAGDLLPWWSEPELRVRFFRPLSAATHLLDARLWPRSPRLMHLHSLIDYGLLLLLVSQLYARLWGRGKLALLALSLYVLDDAHGATLSWLANRNAILTTLFGVACLLAHHRWRTEAWHRGARFGPVVALLLPPALLAVGFLAGEAALATIGYLVAYALFLDPAPPLRRALSLFPTLLIAAAWQVGYRALGFGVRHSGVYSDPAHAPLAFARSVVGRGVALVGSELGGASADLLAWGTPLCVIVLLASSAVVCVCVAAAARPVLRARRLARFWGTGALLAVLPVCASIPGDRLLLFVSVGMMGFVAELLAWYQPAWRRRTVLPPGHARRLVVASRAIVGGLTLRRIVLALLLLPWRTHSMDILAIAGDDAEAAIDRFGREADTVIFVAVPASPAVSYLSARFSLNHRTIPAHIRWLAENRDPVRVTRTGPATLRVAPASGFLASADERLYRDDSRPFQVGDTIRLSELTVTIASLTEDRRPASVDFAFDGPLEQPGRLWLTWRSDRFERFPLPALGGSVMLPATDLAASARHNLGRKPLSQPSAYRGPLRPADPSGQLFLGTGDFREDPSPPPWHIFPHEDDRPYLRAARRTPSAADAPHQSAAFSLANRGG